MKFLIVTRGTAFAKGSDVYYRRHYRAIQTRPGVAGTFGWYWDKALKELGHHTDVFTFYHSESIDRASVVSRRLCELKWRVRPYVEYVSRMANVGLLRAVERVRPDVVLVDAGELLYPDTLSRIKARYHPILVLWLFDDPIAQRWGRVLKAFDAYDLIASFDRDYAAQYARQTTAQVIYLPSACDPDVYQWHDLSEEERQRYGADIAFVGTFQRGRADLLQAIREKTRLGIWTWNRALLRAYPDLRPCDRGLAHGEQASRVYQASKISLNLHHAQTRAGVNMKAFEIAASGGFQLVDAREGLREFFDVEKELVTYRSAEEANEKLAYFLAHDHERQAIARLAAERIRRDHSFLQRLRVLCGVIGA